MEDGCQNQILLQENDLFLAQLHLFIDKRLAEMTGKALGVIFGRLTNFIINSIILNRCYQHSSFVKIWIYRDIGYHSRASMIYQYNHFA